MQYPDDARDSGGSPGADTGPSPRDGDVRRQLQTILASGAFDATERNRRFLSYIVEEALAGRAGRIKAYSIATAVLERDETFDAQSDPIVRIEAGRLRRSLERYYLLAGLDDPVLIEIPKGGYSPTFSMRQSSGRAAAEGAGSQDPTPPPGALSAGGSRSRRGSVLVGAVVLAFGLVVGWLWFAHGLGPFDGASGRENGAETRHSVLVVAFQDGDTNPTNDFLSLGITQDLIGGLLRFEPLAVFDARISQQASSEGAAVVAGRVSADYVVMGTIVRDTRTIRVSASLAEAASGLTIWADVYEADYDAEDLIGVLREITASIVSNIAAPYGAIYTEAYDKLRRQAPRNLSAYDCVLLSYAYRRTHSPSLHASARQCLEDAIEVEPTYVDALAMLALVYLDEYRFHLNPRPNLYDARERALALARKAVLVAPDSALAQMALYDSLFFGGLLDEASVAAVRAVALNPNDPDVLQLVGMRTAFTGDWERGMAMVDRAMALSPAPPGWYHDAYVLEAIHNNDDAEALRRAKIAAVGDFYMDHLLLAVTYGLNGETVLARQEAERAIDLHPGLDANVVDEISMRFIEPRLAARLVEGLREAGFSVTEETRSTAANDEP